MKDKRTVYIKYYFDDVKNVLGDSKIEISHTRENGLFWKQYSATKQHLKWITSIKSKKTYFYTGSFAAIVQIDF